mmetsp:Transcript_20419/g.63473  ORF Transcript_20419/g.63473 Transcript_20419/m.63473 type:complete len:259 (+) Transcript_20419:691-1467(+)
MLRDEVPGDGVPRAREERRGDEERDRLPAPQREPNVVEREHEGPVERVLPRQLLRAHEARAEGVEGDLARGEEELAREGLQQAQLEVARDVGVDAVPPLVLVVLAMVQLEHHRVRHADAAVDEHRQQVVSELAAEGAVVRHFVHGEEERVREDGRHVQAREVRRPRPLERRDGEAEDDGEEGDAVVLSERLRLHELVDFLAVLGHELLAPVHVRLRLVAPNEVLTAARLGVRLRHGALLELALEAVQMQRAAGHVVTA